MNDDQYTIKSGFLSVGDGHKIYFQQWGNPEAKPIFQLHGGPGGGSKDSHKLRFDPRIHHVIFHDQRGAGNSIPFAETKHNTTQDLIGDIEKLRKHFSFEKIQLTGGSWGSFLSLAYAATFPQNVDKILVYGIFGGTREEVDYIQQGGLRTHYPEAWQQYIRVVPKKHQSNTSAYYLEKMLHGTDTEKTDFVRRWNVLEGSAMSLDSDYPDTLLKSQESDEKNRAVAVIEAHYFVHNCFVADSFLLDAVRTLQHIPIVMVHGRFDHVCPPATAYALSEALGASCHLHIVPASHAWEHSLREVVKAYTWSFLGK